MRVSTPVGRAGTLVLWAVPGALGFLAFRRLGLGVGAAAGLVAAIAVGGAFDLPVGRRRSGRLGVNVGGCLVPLAVAGWQAAMLPSATWVPLLAATAVVAAACFALARPVEGRGVLLFWALPGMLGAALGLALAAPARAPAFAYVSGTLGPLVGADLLGLPRLARLGPAHAAVGGAGALDGLVLSGLLATWLAAAT